MILVLASSSPRRRELLTQAGFVFTVDPANTIEDLQPNEQAHDYVCRIAEEKARSVFSRQSTINRQEDDSLMVVGADTCVFVEGKILGKPLNRAEAQTMLEILSGRIHKVLTGVALVTAAGSSSAVEATEVEFRNISSEEMHSYLNGKEPYDKAGAYGIQGYAARWIPRIKGCYFNVVGLPVSRTVELITEGERRLPLRTKP